MYYAEEGLVAGTYNFTVANQTWYAADNEKSFQFTLTKAVPVGGQIVLANAAYDAALAGKKVQTFASSSSADVIEAVTM